MQDLLVEASAEGQCFVAQASFGDRWCHRSKETSIKWHKCTTICMHKACQAYFQDNQCIPKSTQRRYQKPKQECS
jgi:hypothetical protein